MADSGNIYANKKIRNLCSLNVLHLRILLTTTRKLNILPPKCTVRIIKAVEVNTNVPITILEAKLLWYRGMSRTIEDYFCYVCKETNLCASSVLISPKYVKAGHYTDYFMPNNNTMIAEQEWNANDCQVPHLSHQSKSRDVCNMS